VHEQGQRAEGEGGAPVSMTSSVRTGLALNEAAPEQSLLRT